MKLNKTHYILAVIFLSAVIFQSYFVFQTNTFSSDSAYFNIRQVESIGENGKPILKDELSYGEKINLLSPVFHYILSVFSFSKINYKLIPIILMSLIVFVVYLISFSITKDKKASLIAAFISAFIPIYISKTLNQFSIYSIATPLFFFTIYYFILLDKDKKYVNHLVWLSFLLPLIHPIALILPLSFFFYVILTTTESINISKREKEVIIFSTLAILLIESLIYKKAFVEYGLNILFQNIPREILGSYFKDLSLINTILSLGVIPLVLGVIGLYFGYIRKKKSVYILTSIIVSVFSLLLLKYIDISTGLTFLGISLVVLSSIIISDFLTFIRETKISKIENPSVAILVVLIILLSIVPSAFFASDVISSSYPNEDIETLQWIEQNTFSGSVVLAPLEYGHLITSISKRVNILDSNFLMAPLPSQRLIDVNEVYTTPSKVKASEIINKYEVNYILLTPKIKEKLKIEKLAYLENEKCFEEVKEGVIKVLC
ncbi:MAG: hypothetical protein HYS32_02435 [Candidatus Woesearchaeota archaeon]|nr:MAG: hypothetical protein HYS32_02435 [Candidatus Woesearchaeota archaeon]